MRFHAIRRRSVAGRTWAVFGPLAPSKESNFVCQLIQYSHKTVGQIKKEDERIRMAP